MNKTVLYKSFFYFARIISIIISASVIFLYLNAKYSIFENVFPSIVSFLNFSSISESRNLFFNVLGFYLLAWKYLLAFFVYFQYICMYLITSTVLMAATYLLCKDKICEIIINMFIITLAYILLLVNGIIEYKTIHITALFGISFILFFINIYIEKDNKLLKPVLIIPVIADILFISHILNYISGNFKLLKKIISALIINLCVTVIFIAVINIEQVITNQKNLITNGNLCTIISKNDGSIVMNDKDKKEIVILDKNGRISRRSVVCEGMFDGFAYNNIRHEFYYYDGVTGEFIVLNDNFKIKNKKILSTEENDAFFGSRIVHTDSNILVILEKGMLYDLDINTLDIKKSLPIPRMIDCSVINKFRNSCLISFWLDQKYFIEYSMDTNKISNIEAPSLQGYIQISNRNKEIYLAAHQNGRIYVYDAITYKLKRKIKTNYTVKDITYDEDLNIIIAPSYIKGDVDIFLMDGSDRKLWHNFIGCMLREARFDNGKDNLIVVSQHGLYKVKLDIESLIKVSHETLSIK